MDACAGVHRARLAGFFIVQANASLALHRRNIPVQRALESRFFEQDGMQRLGKAANIVQGGLRDFADFLEILAQRRAFRGLIARAAKHGADGGEHLAEFVVQFAGNVTER